MNPRYAKTIRRRLLLWLYDRYLRDPLDMPGPEELMEEGPFTREDLFVNVHYLHDRGLVELLMSPIPPLFSAARITADGIDLVENYYELNLRFPAVPSEAEEELGEVPVLVERLVEEVDLSPTDGETRKAMLRDVQFLREELARPVTRWRPHVVRTILDWLAEGVKGREDLLPSLRELRTILMERRR